MNLNYMQPEYVTSLFLGLWKSPIKKSPFRLSISGLTQQSHDIYAMSHQFQCNVMYDVASTLIRHYIDLMCLLGKGFRQSKGWSFMRKSVATEDDRDK